MSGFANTDVALSAKPSTQGSGLVTIELDEQALDKAMVVAPLPINEGAARHRRKFLRDAITAYLESVAADAGRLKATV